MQKQAILKIYGKVQGVFFRDLSRMKARELNLSGWVRNEPDGTLQIVAEGEDKNLREFIEWCKYGPDSAEVEETKISWQEPTGEFNDFLIK